MYYKHFHKKIFHGIINMANSENFIIQSDKKHINSSQFAKIPKELNFKGELRVVLTNTMLNPYRFRKCENIIGGPRSKLLVSDFF